MKTVQELTKMRNDLIINRDKAREELEAQISKSEADVKTFTEQYEKAVKDNYEDEARSCFESLREAEFKLSFNKDRLANMNKIILSTDEYQKAAAEVKAQILAEDIKATRKALDLISQFIDIALQMKERDESFNTASRLLYDLTDRETDEVMLFYEKNHIVTMARNLNGMNGFNFNTGALAETRAWLRTKT